MPPITTFPAPPEPGNVYHADCFTLLDALEPESVNAIITDMPYGVTCAEWDTVVDLPRWWQSVKRVLKPRGVMVTTASQPFTSALVMSNPAWFHQELIWVKQHPKGFLDARRKHLDNHENVLIFSNGNPHYAPQGTIPVNIHSGRENKSGNGVYGKVGNKNYIQLEGNFPRSVLHFNALTNGGEHPTQKPVPLYEYLTLTYTQPGDLIVDPFCGSGTSLLAARNLNRRFIGGDITEPYVELARRRLAAPYTLPMFEQPAP